MTRYQINGETFTADTPTELVRQLAVDSFAQDRTPAEWMEASANRAGQMTGHPVRYGTPDEFVADMVAAGLIKVLN